MYQYHCPIERGLKCINRCAQTLIYFFIALIFSNYFHGFVFKAAKGIIDKNT